ncbi:tRNA pseudouridine synthase A [Psychroflexus salis]|uniref:tRNA pseudouridine synthase A n=1 Tax=Psychroflexus salis TaxID=1526574 RepID=A0A917E764_9FLAO|nr:tRNA pseudouridine(38-40) synthase TruA [Psychroflexus salis]GGE11507.1 tRNA pseudouridine synthase A [Psychroflexus salis]
MKRLMNYYLIELQYLGFRYHGWQKQPKVKTVENQIQKTLGFVLPNIRTKVIAAGRTDAMVSVHKTYVELFVYEADLPQDFFELFNYNLPSDIRAVSIKKIDEKFNIIQHPKQKEYLYFFTFPEKIHPFCAPFITLIQDDLNLELMQEAARLFEGEHDFYSYAFRPKPTTQTLGNITYCRIEPNTIYTANFFPEKSYVLRVKSSGFKRNQIRLMMGVLINLGKGKIDLNFVKQSLDGSKKIKLEYIAPASGLQLYDVHFTQNF